MGAPKFGKDGLTIRERKFCALLVAGATKTDAYLQSYGAGTKTKQSVYTAARDVSQKPRVIARMAELLAAADLADIDSVQAAARDLLSDIESAREAGNWSAVAALTDRRLRALGMLTDRVVLSPESRMTDQELIDALAKGDPTLADSLKLSLASKEGWLS